MISVSLNQNTETLKIMLKFIVDLNAEHYQYVLVDSFRYVIGGKRRKSSILTVRMWDFFFKIQF